MPYDIRCVFMLIYVSRCAVLLYNMSYVLFTTYGVCTFLPLLGVEKLYFLMLLAVQTVFAYEQS